MKKLAIIIGTAILLFLPSMAVAAPISWDFNGTILQPLQSAWSSLVKADHFQATSTITASIFPYASTTAVSAATLCLTGDTCRTTWPSGSTPGGTSGQVQYNANGSLGGTGTTTLSGSGLISISNTPVVLGATPSVASLSNISANTFLANITGASAAPIAVATSSFFSATQGTSLPYASTTALTVSSLATGVLHSISGAITSSLIDLANDVTGVLGVPNGGTGWANLQANTVLLGNGVGKIATTSAGTNGQILSLFSGTPTWVSTTTFNSPLTYTSGAVSCATCLTVNQSITLSGAVTGSGATSITTAFGTLAQGVLGNPFVAATIPTAQATSTLYGAASTGGFVLGWSNVLNGLTLIATSSSGGTPGGSNGQVQFNSSGSFGADSNLFWDNTNKRFAIGTSTTLTSLGTILASSSNSSLTTATPAFTVFTATTSSATANVITFDNSLAQTTSTGGQTVAYTVGVGTNRYITVITLATGGDTTSAATYAGSSMTLLKTSILATDELKEWGLAAPTSGSNNIVTTVSGSNTSVVEAESFASVAQSGSAEASGSTSNTGTTCTVSVTTITDGDWLAGAARTGNGMVAGSNTTVRNSPAAINVIDSNGIQTPPGTFTLNVTQSPSSNCNMVAVALKPVTSVQTNATSTIYYPALTSTYITGKISVNSTTTPAIGIGTSTPGATFAVQSAWGVFVRMFSTVIAGVNYVVESIDQWGHLHTGGPAPTCGTGCSSVTGDDRTFRAITGSGVTAVTVNFSHTYTTTPVCISADESGGTTVSDASSTPSSVTMNLSASLTTKSLGVICQISDNFTF